MSHSVEELVKTVYEAFAQGDVPTVLGQFAPDIVWNEAEIFIYADRNPYRGQLAILEGVFLRIASEWDGFTATPAQIVVDGDTAVALGRYRGTCKATKVSVDAQFAHVWTAAGGKLIRFQQYTDTAQINAAAARSQAASA